MKIMVKIILFLFMVFLSMPTVISLIEKDVKASFFYDLSEEEVHKEIKAELKINEYTFFSKSKYTSSLILSENRSKHDKIKLAVFTQPPNS